MTVGIVARNMKRVVVLVLCASVSIFCVLSVRQSENPHAPSDFDFAESFYAARCALEQHDPYDGVCTLRAYEADGGTLLLKSPTVAKLARLDVAIAEYPPTGLFVLAPLAALPWHLAHVVWFWLIAGLLVLAALAMWDLSSETSTIAGCIGGFMLVNCMMLLDAGNPAGVVVPLAVIAAWCFLERRFEVAGIASLAVTLMIKPQIAEFVWLYFVLAGGTGRKRALQTLAAVIVLGIWSAFWIARSSPHWTEELPNHIAMLAGRGAMNNVGPTGLTYMSPDPIICLENAFSVIDDDPRFYDSLSYVIGGGLILAWGITVLRKQLNREGAVLGLAAASVLMLLPVYHRSHDAKLLMLTIPACAMLWARGGARRWMALILTGAAIFFTSDVANILLYIAQSKIPAAPSGLGGKLKLLMEHPAPIVLLAAGCFYLWVYVCWKSDEPAEESTGSRVAAAVIAGGEA